MTRLTGQKYSESLEFLTEIGTITTRFDTRQRLIVSLAPVAIVSTVFVYLYTNPHPLVETVLGLGSLLLAVGLYLFPPRRLVDCELVTELAPDILPDDVEIIVYEEESGMSETVPGHTVVLDILSPNAGWRYVMTYSGTSYQIDRVLSFPVADPPPTPEPADDFLESEFTSMYEIALPETYDAQTNESVRSVTDWISAILKQK